MLSLINDKNIGPIYCIFTSVCVTPGTNTKRNGIYYFMESSMGNLATTRWTKFYLSGISNKPTWVQPRSYPEGLRWLGATFKTGPSPLGSRGTYQRPKPYLVLSGNQPSRHPVSRRNARSPPPPQGPHMSDDSCLSGTCARPDHCGQIRHFWESNPRPRDWRRKPGPLDQVTHGNSWKLK